MPNDGAFLGILVFVIIVCSYSIASSITSKLEQIIGQLVNVQESLASLLEEAYKISDELSKLKT